MSRCGNRFRKDRVLCGLALILAALGGFTRAGWAQEQQRVEIPSSPNPVGSGARALGMGGAFIAVADDATAASWNPGGLIQLERPEVSVVGAAFHRIEDNSFSNHPEGNGVQTVSEAKLNYLSGAYPFTLLDHNMIVSLNYQHLYDFTRAWNFTLRDEGSNTRRAYEQDGGLYAYGLAYCIQILPELSFGFTLNLWEDGIYPNGWDTTDTSKGTARLAAGDSMKFSQVRQDHYSFNGFNANVGMLWNITSKLTLGAVFKTPFTADLEHEYRAQSAWTRPDGETWVQRKSFTADEELDMPMSYGLGLAYRFSDRFTLSGDVYRTHWEDFLLTDSEGHQSSPVSGRAAGRSDIDPTTQVRLGAEYLIIRPEYVIPLRGGIFYDPSPAEGNSDAYYGFSLGSGIGIGRFVFDMAYQFRYGPDVGSSILRNLGFSQDLYEHMVYSSLIFYF